LNGKWGYLNEKLNEIGNTIEWLRGKLPGMTRICLSEHLFTQNLTVETQYLTVETQYLTVETQYLTVETPNRTVETQNRSIDLSDLAISLRE